MNKAAAIERLTNDPRNPIYFVEKDTTGTWFDWSLVWLADGELVMGHPTDFRAAPISAPEGDHYHVAPMSMWEVERES